MEVGLIISVGFVSLLYSRHAKALLVFAVLLASVVHAQSSPASTLLGPVPVERVIDGDTVILESNLGPRVVRLIGIDTPEVSHPEKGQEPFGLEASDFTKSLLPPGTSVWVELDLETEDAYGRLLAYLYTKSPTGTWVIDSEAVIQVNLAIAEAGFARTLNIEPNSLYVDLFEDAVLAAQQSELGMWSTSTQAERETDAPTAPAATEGAKANTDPPVEATGEISIACILYNPSAEGDEGAEVVTLVLSSAMNTRGFNLYDKGSGTILRLPAGDQPPGELKVLNPGKGIWNNGGDTIYLQRGEEEIDEWDYTDSVVSGEDITICRDP